MKLKVKAEVPLRMIVELFIQVATTYKQVNLFSAQLNGSDVLFEPHEYKEW